MGGDDSSLMNSRTIIGFAAQLVDHDGQAAAEAYARNRGWIDENGHPTTSGLDLVKALEDQTGTRTAFRRGF
ncbi:MAG: hypothetical protein AAFQ67_02755 [Pseudomonadota bacterium]